MPDLAPIGEGLSGLSPTGDVAGLRRPDGNQAAGSFGQMFQTLISDVQETQQQANQKVEAVMAGDSTHLHEAMLAMQRADLTLQLVIQVRNKLLDTYQEIQRMQI